MDGCVTAVEPINRPRAFMAGKKLILARTPVAAATLRDTDRTMTDIARDAVAG